MKRELLCLFVFSMLLAACSAGAEPRLIAKHPLADEDPPGLPPTYWQPSPLPETIVYHAELVLQVYRPGAAAGNAERLVHDYEGYLAGSDHWDSPRGEYFTLELAVPPEHFSELRAALLELGDLQRETVWEDWQPYRAGYERIYSHVTLRLEPAITVRVDFPETRWKSWRTLQKAVQMSLSLVRFLLDMLIWVVVLLAPFVLLAWGTYALARRLRRG